MNNNLYLFKVLAIENNQVYYALVVAKSVEDALQSVEDDTCIVTAVYGRDTISGKLMQVCGGVLVFNEEGWGDKHVES